LEKPLKCLVLAGAVHERLGAGPVALLDALIAARRIKAGEL
jgi:hypothetical protein